MQTLRILVVDDELGMRLGVVRALRNFAVSLPDINDDVTFALEQAADGAQARACIDAGAPDILLLDHKLPDTTGLDILDELNQSNSEILTIMVTAYASLDTAVTATKRGAYDFLAKPFTPEELKGAVRKATKHLILQREARRLAEEKRQIRFQFTSMLAHEMKAPLAAVEGYLRIIRDRAAGDDPAVYDHMLDRSMLRLEGMRKVILDLLDLTAIESGQKKRDLTEIDVRQVARDAVETFIPQAADREITVSLHAPRAAPVTADRMEIEMILNNLISNAIKYNRQGGRVDARIDVTDGVVTIRVADTGIGMTPEDTQRLFHDFVRIKNEQTRGILGSGLGLSIVKKLALLYGGNVTVDSEPGNGSTFEVTLRQHADNSTESNPVAADSLAAGSR